MAAANVQPVRGSRFPTLEKYEVIEELGHGGMATVYRARDLRLGRDVAVKVIHPHLRDSTEAVRRFSIEARAVAKLRHPNIVEVYDISAETDAEQFLVVELLRGVTLRKLLELHGAMPAEVAAAIALELLGALEHAHDEGVIHRDVKPENVLLEHRGMVAKTPANVEPGTTERPPEPTLAPPSPGRSSETPGDRVVVKLTDFGIAKLLDAQGVTSTGQVLGSPAHMAPEQIEGREVDARADVFGMGVLLYECMVGHLPFQGQNPAQVLRRVLEGEYPSAESERPTVGRTWSRILDRALASDMEERYASCPEMRDALARELTRLGVASPRGEIQAWLDDPAGFGRAQEATMGRRLCALAEAASRRGDALTAAADYNRALAFSPGDAALLRLVSHMNRRSARLDAMRRAWPYASGVVLVAGLGGGAWYAAHRPRGDAGPDYLTPIATISVPVPASTVVLAASTRAVAEPPASARTLAHPVVGRNSGASAKAAVREVRFSDVQPQEGVLVAIDGAPPAAIDVSQPLVLDAKAHSLGFSCMHNLCDTFMRAIEASDRGVVMPVHLNIKPSKLVIQGDPNKHYILREDPSRPLQAGDFAYPIAMPQSARRVVSVVEMDTNRSQNVELQAAHTSTVKF